VRFAFLPLLLFGCGQEPPIAASDLSVDLRVPISSVAVGQGFHITVRRVFRADLDVDPILARDLDPIPVREIARRRRTGQGRIEETIRFQAHLFEPGPHLVPALRVAGRPRGGGPALSAASAPVRIDCEAVLPDSEDALEGPGAPPERPWPWPWILASALGLGLAAAPLVARALARRRSARGVELQPVQAAQADIAALLARGTQGPDARSCAQLRRILHRFGAARFPGWTPGQTGLEALGRARIPGPLRAELARIAAALEAGLYEPGATVDVAALARDLAAWIEAAGNPPGEEAA
jgi:hypothetical protein